MVILMTMVLDSPFRRAVDDLVVLLPVDFGDSRFERRFLHDLLERGIRERFSISGQMEHGWSEGDVSMPCVSGDLEDGRWLYAILRPANTNGVRGVLVVVTTPENGSEGPENG